MLINQGKQALGNDRLLRVYWYDGVRGEPTYEHRRIADVPDVQLRMGGINGKGQQKGVDAKIVIDLIELASNHAMSDALVITGDGDMADAIELAQRQGVRIALLGLEDQQIGVHHAQSQENISIADRVVRIEQKDIQPFARLQTERMVPSLLSAVPINVTLGGDNDAPPTGPAQFSVAAESVPSTSYNYMRNDLVGNDDDDDNPSEEEEAIIRQAVDQFVNSRPLLEWTNAMPQPGLISRDIDKQLVFHTYSTLNRGALTDSQKRLMRSCFRLAIAHLMDNDVPAANEF